MKKYFTQGLFLDSVHRILRVLLLPSTLPTPTTTTTMSGFYLIQESDLFVFEIWICSLFYLYMYVCMYVCILVLFWCYFGVTLVLKNLRGSTFY